jgi:flavorubredoxin
MHCVKKVTKDLYWVGANDRRLALFENIHPIPRGVSYNSYLLMDEKTVLIDTVDWSACRQFLENVEYVLDGRKLDYLIINHLEPDHAASIDEILIRYPETVIISNERAFMLMRQFGFNVGEYIEVKEGDSQSFGKHELAFVFAPMVHWPEVMLSFDVTNGVLFSADAFGSFGALDGKIFNDEFDIEREWMDDMRRYYTNIVGKYGPHVQNVLKKAGTIDIEMVCPLHGPVWRSDLAYFIDKYDKWSRYEPEEMGVLIVYGSMYGNTESAAGALAGLLADKGMTNIKMYDVSGTHVSYLISETFRYSHIVIASVTYNLNIFPPVHDYLMDMKALNVQNRTFALMENGSWAPKSGTLIREFIDKNIKKSVVLDETLSIHSYLPSENAPDLERLADAIVESLRPGAK